MRKLLLLVLGLCCYGMLSAQIVNIESKRKSFDSLGWYGRLDLGANLVENNRSVFTFSSGLRVDYLRDRASYLLLSNYQIIRAGTESIINNGFFHLRMANDLKKAIQWESFSQIQYNEQLKIRIRALIGSGPRLRVLNQAKSKIYLGVLYMYEYNEIGQSEVVFRDHRLSNYLSYSLHPNDQISLNGIFYHQPLINDLANARLSLVSSCSFKINQLLSLQIRFNLSHDERLRVISPGVPATTYQFLNGLTFSF